MILNKKNLPFYSEGKVDIYDIDVEKLVIAQLISEPKSSFNQLINLNLKASYFFDKAHRNLFEALKQMFDEGKAISLITLKDRLKKNKKLEEIGGMPYLAKLASESFGSLAFKEHCMILIELSIKRLTKELSDHIGKQALDPSVDAFDTLNHIVERVSAWEQGLTTDHYSFLSEEMAKEVKEQEERQNQEKKILGVTSGMPSLDNVLNGWQKDTLSIVAARPSVGKTALMLSWMLAAGKTGKKAMFFSLEMSKRQLRKRILAQHTDIPSDALKKGGLTDDQWADLYDQTADLVQLPICLDSTPHISLSELRAKCRHLKFVNGLDVVFIDYLQLMEVNDFGRRFSNREQEISYVSRNLKALAIELNIPIVVASQLSRSIESRGNYQFKLSDLRESGSIEQDADNVMFIHRPAAYGITQDMEGNDVSQFAELHLLKHRDGETGKFALHFAGEKMHFKEMDNRNIFNE